ncbi:MAG: hypothetical protein QG671_1349 [Actinomycetota bacterium]|nr:hypothetical protein [Actinomycetota bacterium]
MFFAQDGLGDPPILFVHGFGCDLSDWQAQFERLRARNRLVACDLRGHGATPGLPADCSIETYGSDVALLLEELDLSAVVLVGHSMGCRVVLEAYRKAPERVAGIVLLDGSAVGAGDPVSAERAMAQQLDDEGYEHFVRRFFEAMFTPASDPDVKDAIIERALRMPTPVGRALFPRLARWDAGTMDAALAGVSVPLMVLQSTAMNADRVRVSLRPGQSSPWLELIGTQIPRARIEVLPGAGHFPHVEQPDDVAALIGDFVASLR